MKNVWLDKVDRALLWLGYPMETINFLDEQQKEGIIIEEYLFRMNSDREDVAPMTLEEMAEFLTTYQRGL